jgi:hypothetical protein
MRALRSVCKTGHYLRRALTPSGVAVADPGMGGSVRNEPFTHSQVLKGCALKSLAGPVEPGSTSTEDLQTLSPEAKGRVAR